MKMTKLILIAIFALLVVSSFTVAATEAFTTKLIGGEEKTAVMTGATGEAVFTLGMNGKEISYDVEVKNIADAVAAHIHAGKKGAEGPPVAVLFTGPRKAGIYSGELSKGIITDKNLVGPLSGKSIADLVALIKSGDAYVNVHTAKNPGGEIRGQVQ